MFENARNLQPSEIAQKTAQMIDMLPENEQVLAYETVKRFVLAWDPDFIKMTDLEAHRITKAEEELSDGNFVEHGDINWN